MGQQHEKEWSVKIIQFPNGRAVARFGHRKGGAGWVWDEVPFSPFEIPTTEAGVLNELYAAVCEFLERCTG